MHEAMSPVFFAFVLLCRIRLNDGHHSPIHLRYHCLRARLRRPRLSELRRLKYCLRVAFRDPAYRAFPKHHAVVLYQLVHHLRKGNVCTKVSDHALQRPRLGVTSSKRSPVFPELPTISESGLPGYEHVVFNAILAPTGTPRDILGRMHGEIVKALQQPDIRGRFLEQGVELPASSSPEECSAFVKAETEKYAKIAQLAGIRPE